MTPVFPPGTQSLSVALELGEEVGRTEEACPLGAGASGQQLPVWFQAGGPAHLTTEEPFMGLGSQDGGGGGRAWRPLR